MDREERILGDNIYLLEMDEQDTKNIILWRNKTFVRKQCINRDLLTEETHLNWIQTRIKTGEVKQFIIYIKEGDYPIGSVYLRDIDRKNQKAEFGIFIGEEACLGKGFGEEAAKLILHYAFTRLCLHKIILRVLASNERARRCYEKAGFREEGYFRDEVVIDGEYCDLIFMAVINNGKEA